MEDILRSEDITVAVTVFNRRQFLKQAIRSALEQTAPVRVIVVEDCGPDAGLEAFVRDEFGSRIEYFRNPRRRGLFDNWNACIEYCRTPWLSILHDDDYLTPVFAEALTSLHQRAPGCGLYFGETPIHDDDGNVVPCAMRPPLKAEWQRVNLADTLDITPFPFPGHIFKVEYARALGGFRGSSQYCGDWEMWSNLIAHYGAAQTSVVVGYNVSHGGLERGTSKIYLNGRLRPLTFIQQKRILHLLRQEGANAAFDRAELLRRSPMSIRYLIEQGASLSPRLLRYNVGLLARSTPPNRSYALLRMLIRMLGVRFVKLLAHAARLRLRKFSR
jgi:glycosyltransferase involved in cell wall biosynthesis